MYSIESDTLFPHSPGVRRGEVELTLTESNVGKTQHSLGECNAFERAIERV